MAFPRQPSLRLQLLTELPATPPGLPAQLRAELENKGAVSLAFSWSPARLPRYKNSVKATLMFPAPSEGHQRKVNRVLHIHGGYDV